MADRSPARIIIDLYESESLLLSAIGVSLKFSYEYTVAFLMTAPVVLTLGVVFDEFRFVVVPSPSSVYAVWVTGALTLTGIIWCFTYAGLDNTGDAADDA